MRKLLLLLTMLSMVACGSHVTKPSPSTPTPSPTPASSAGVSITQVRGMHIQAAQTTVKTTSSIVWGSIFSLPKVEAAITTTVTVAQNWEGECSSSPTVGDTASFVLFGVGQTVDPTCSHEFRPNDMDGSGAASVASSGKTVFGNGTLSNLQVTTERGTVVASPNGVLISVFLQRGTTVVPTGLTCVIPQGGDELACANTGTFAALTGDKVIVVVVLGSGDALTNISVALTKSLT